MRQGTLWSSEYVWLNLDWHEWTVGFWWNTHFRTTVVLHLGPFTVNIVTKKRWTRGPNDPCGWCGEFHQEGFYHNVPSTDHLR